MNLSSPDITKGKKIIPGLFQIAARADNSNFQCKRPLKGLMINPRKLEMILKTIANIGKPSASRLSARSLQK